MNYAEKKKLVEGLKKNERAYCFLSKEEKAVLEELKRHVGVVRNGSDLCADIGEWYCTSASYVYRIKPSYTLPIEPPKGYQLVTDKEMACSVIPPTAILISLPHGDWESAERIKNCPFLPDNGFAYAVPIGFSFEPEETISIDGDEYTIGQIKSALKNAKGK